MAGRIHKIILAGDDNNMWNKTHTENGHFMYKSASLCCAWPHRMSGLYLKSLTHWGRVTHICVGTNTNIGSDNGLSPGRHQAIIWTNAGILSIGPSATNFSEILIESLTFSLKKMLLQVSSAKWRQSCLGLNVLKGYSGNIIPQNCSNYIRVNFKPCGPWKKLVELGDYQKQSASWNHASPYKFQTDIWNA